MKKNKIIYWISTAVFCLAMVGSASMYLTSDEVKESFKVIGFPDFFRIELAVAKLIGVLVLLIPVVSDRLKEWAYAGFGITLISAVVAHLSNGDPVANVLGPVFFMAILTVSYLFGKKISDKSPKELVA